jgi:hypothetical protein
MLKFTLRHIRLNNGGYDVNGGYWGNGEPLFWYCSDCGKHSEYIRAISRDAAKSKIRSYYHKTICKFYR